ncbi:hypothetical protein GQ457_05G027480 [Hibiscus cannabinus]
METHISGKKADGIIRKHGFDHSFRVEATGFSGGIWLLWKGNLRVDVLAVSNQFIHVNCEERESEFVGCVTFVYASPMIGMRNLLWNQLEALCHADGRPWLLGGDFNAIVSESERMGARLEEMEYVICLDRCLVNTTWHDIWSDSFVQHLPRLGSDHHPISVNTVDRHTRRDHTNFKYMTAWQSDDSFKAIWNKETFGHIGQRKRSCPRGRFEKILATELEKLVCSVIIEEVREAIFDMGPLKAPGADGLHAMFYQKNWDVVGRSVVQFFRPISLCSVTYKTLSKVIVNRLKPLLPSWVSLHRWNEIWLSRRGPDLSHLFFADDLVIFAEATFNQMEVIRDVLQWFFEASGHKVNATKTQLFFSKNTSPDICSDIVGSFGFSEVQDLGRYLGVPLLHRRVNKVTYGYIIEKSTWLPSSVCLEVEKLIQGFVWGHPANHRGVNLVSWDDMKEPIDKGGLGFRSLLSQNCAFLMKVGFQLISEDDKLWVRVLRAPLALLGVTLTPCPVASFVTADGDWDILRLRNILPEECVHRILGMLPPRAQLGADRIIWKEAAHVNAKGKKFIAEPISFDSNS